MTEVDMWFGDNDTQPLGPIKAILIEHLADGESKIQITDPFWKDHVGYDEDEDYFYTCNKLPSNNYVRYDDYCWSYPGECTLNTKWW